MHTDKEIKHLNIIISISEVFSLYYFSRKQIKTCNLIQQSKYILQVK